MIDLRDLIGLKTSEIPFKIRVHDVVHHEGVNNYAVILINGFGTNEQFIRTEVSWRKVESVYNMLLKESEGYFDSIEDWEKEFKKHCIMFNYYPTDTLRSHDGLESINIFGKDYE